MFADDQIVFISTQDNLQYAVQTLNNATKEYNLKISTSKTKIMAFLGQEQVTAKIVLGNHTLEQVNIKQLGCNLSYLQPDDTDRKL